MTAVIVTEKESAAQNMAKALGGMRGTYDSTPYVITHLRGHLYEFVDVADMVSPDLKEKYRVWNLENLPWDVNDLTWKRRVTDRADTIATTVESAIRGADEVVIATDIDPSGEGDLLFWEVIVENNLTHQSFSRMEFTDEAPKSLQKAFTQRRTVTSMEDEGGYRKALFRAKWDYLSMQFTRIATAMAYESGQQAVVRQGRLKSAMVRLVGDQLKAHREYVKKPFYQNRFRDNHNVVYVSPEEPKFEKSDDVPATYEPSPVVADGVERKRTSPPRLYDLAAMSARLSQQGVKSGQVLATYQKMYEAQVVSYPRTEDKTITFEQFAELEPLIDRIATAIGVDPALLTHRTPRKTHVKDTGAHGANRPGVNVPASLDDVEATYGRIGRLIYDTVARNFLAMCAPDYEYDRHTGHIEKYPQFVGHANVPQVNGWRDIFSDDDDSDEDIIGEGLGSQAEPFVHEGANKRPQHPTMKWLMKQLEKHDVGTGATRTSTFADVTNTRAKYPLLEEKGQKLYLATTGEISWRLLPHTRIGDITITEKVFAYMRDIATKGADPQPFLDEIATWVKEDIATMRTNADAMRTHMGLKKEEIPFRATGVWRTAPGGPRSVSFKQRWGGHEFTDDEVQRLLAGETITITATTKSGSHRQVTGSLGVGEFRGKKYIGFQEERPDKPHEWCQYTFSADEIEQLCAGKKILVEDAVSAQGRKFSCHVSWDANKKKIIPHFDSDTPPASWCGHKFTDAERRQLIDGRTIELTDCVSKAGKKFSAKVAWMKDGKTKRIVPDFAGGSKKTSGTKQKRGRARA